jgi:ribose-phosphate pyrophosphokinase
MNNHQDKVVIQFNAPQLGKNLATALNLPVIAAEVVRFADTECDVVLECPFPAIAGKHVVLAAQLGGRFAAWSTNDFLLSICFLVKRLQASHVASITCVLPYYPYARQDLNATHGGVSSAGIMGDIFKAMGVDQLITIDLHNAPVLHQTELAVTALSSVDFWVPVLRNFMDELGDVEYVLVAPDAGAASRVQAVARALGIASRFVAKRRPEINQAAATVLSDEVTGKYALILDDIIDTGRTAASAAELVLSRGAVGVSGFFTHAVLSAASLAVLPLAAFDRVVVTDSVHHSSLSYANMDYVSMLPFIVEQCALQIDLNRQVVSMSQGVYGTSV